MKKVIIIGGGIAGLSAGVYARKCGLDTTILESHSTAGGNCTSWRRGGYLFEGGMHWLAGSNPRDPLNQLWRCIGALGDDVPIHYKEPFAEYDHNGTPVRLYRDLDRTEQHLLELSPADAAEIKALCNNIRNVQREEEVDAAYYELSSGAYADRFVHAGIGELIRSVTGDKQGILMLLFTLASLANGDGGFPEGGSLPFVRRIVQTYTSLGGSIRCNARADRVVVQDGRATGVVCGGVFIPADAVIVTSDTMMADQLFEMPLHAPWLDRMRALAGPTMTTLVSLGIDADLKGYPERPIFKLSKPIFLGPRTYRYLSVNNYAADPHYSPDGKTAMMTQLSGDTYAFWKKAKEEGRYAQEKQKIADQVMAAVSAQFPEADGHIEIWDVATPLTYERYCGNWKGSWMTELTTDMSMEPYPSTIEGLDGVYFAGQRLMPPGGLPPAMLTGRAAVEQLCRNVGVMFVGEE